MDLLIIFNDSEAVPPGEILADLHRANLAARSIWNDRKKSLTVRWTECDRILGPVIGRNLTAKRMGFVPIPLAASRGLDEVFLKHYGTPDGHMLIGKAQEASYDVQDLYALEVGKLLGSFQQKYRSRAITQLGKAYGRSSMPLLSISSVAALWKMCKSKYYRDQLSLVGLTYPCVGQLTDP